MVRSNNYFSALRHIIYIIEKDFLIGLPRTTHNEEVVIFCKSVEDRELFGLCGNVGNTVETGVSHHLSAVDIDNLKQLFRLIILQIQTAKRHKSTAENFAIPSKKDLLFAKYSRDNIGLHPTFTQGIKVIQPEFVFHKKDLFRPDCRDKSIHIFGSIDREICHNIGSRIILPHLIARRGEKSE